MTTRRKKILIIVVGLVAVIAVLGYRASRPPYAFLSGLEPFETKDLGGGDAQVLKFAVKGSTEEWKEKIDRELVPLGFLRARIPSDAKPRRFGWATPPRASQEPSDVSVGLTENYGRAPGTHTIVLSFRNRGLLGWFTRTWKSIING